MKLTNVAGVQFRPAGKIYNFLIRNLVLRIGDQVVVETERGQSTAEIITLNSIPYKENSGRNLRPIIRRLSPKELGAKGYWNEEKIIQETRQQINKHRLDMKLLKVEPQSGNSKITIFFASARRVDFRELVKELAKKFKARIELKQVGARDESKLVGGMGVCGREYCCSTFLREFVPVSIKMAKNQNLALNPTKVSGGCGRLLCCLTYEDQTYNKLKRQLPPLQSKVKILASDTWGLVQKVDLLNQTVLLNLKDGSQELKKVEELEFTPLKRRRDPLINANPGD